MNPRNWGRMSIGGFSAAAAILVIVVISWIISMTSTNAATPAASPTPTASASAEPLPTPSAQVEVCPWATAPSDYTNNRWFGDGIAEIKNASTDAEAAAAAHVWLNEVRKDPSLLAGTAKYLLHRDVDAATLSTDGCATEAAVQLVTELELVISMGSVVSVDAPANGFNSGVDNGIVVGSATSGINGDRSAVKITLPDGTVVWIMARCGNIVTITPPVVPPGPTDEKDPSLDPAPRGNAPEGGGRNQDSGPGTYIPPTEMDQPPATPYMAPAAPEPVVSPAPVGPTPDPAPAPPVGSTPDPTPEPAPEISAPPVNDAEDGGCSPAPGETTC